PRMELVVGGQHLTLGQTGIAAPEIADEAAGLAHQQNASGNVPELQILFPEAVEATGGDPGEIERGGAEAPDPRHFRRDRVEDLVETAEIAMRLVGNAGRDQRLIEMAPRGNAEAPFVQPAAPALLGPEAFVGDRVVDQALGDLAPALPARL